MSYCKPFMVIVMRVGMENLKMSLDIEAEAFEEG